MGRNLHTRIIKECRVMINITLKMNNFNKRNKFLVDN